MKIGVLALQGAFKEHIDALNKLGIDNVEIRKVEQLIDIDGLILPGGESTTIGKLLIELDIKDKLVELLKNGLPVWGTCAGMIVLAKDIGSENPHLSTMDIRVVRNAYGRQLGSFIQKEQMDWMGEKPFPMVFIRAPFIETCHSSVKVIQEVDGKIVAARQNKMFVTSFHPELTEDTRCLEYFISMIN